MRGRKDYKHEYDCVRVFSSSQHSEKEDSKIATVVVRGSTDNIMDDIERAVDDAINTYKALTRDPRFVPGAGATEIELAKQLANYGEVCVHEVLYYS